MLTTETMKHQSISFLINLSLTTALLISSHLLISINCEQSTVFIFETSDSAPLELGQPSSVNSAGAPHSSSPVLVSSGSQDDNTRIITDDGAPSFISELTGYQQPAYSTFQNNQPIATSSNPKSPDRQPPQASSTLDQPHHQLSVSSPSSSSSSSVIFPSSINHQSNLLGLINPINNRDEPPIPLEEVTTVRRLEEEAVNPPPQPPKLPPKQQPQPQPPKPSTTASPSRNLQAGSTGGPLATASKPKPAGTGANNNNNKTEADRLLISITSDEDDYRPNRPAGDRKPSITISIQPDGTMKQNGAGQQVILRPSENGQGIVIATVGGPPIATIGGGGSSNQNVMIHSNNNNKPITLPINSNNRPPVSTLVDNPRPQNNPRPNNNNQNQGSFPDEQPQLRPPTNRPIGRPVNQPDFDNGPPERQPQNTQLQQFGESKFPLNEKNCGLMQETRIVGGDEANPEDFLWMAAIIKSKPANGEVRPFCGGSLITRRHVLTAAHCLENLAPRDVLVRLGSYDFDDSTASSMSADYAIDQFRVPASYSKKTHQADIAIMRLKTPISINDNYKTVCMPQSRRSYVGALGTVTGYGSQSTTFKRASPKLRQVTVPVWENRKCSVVYKRNLTESFLCAGYEEGGKDACQGDSGGPLMTEGPNERMMIIGVVSFGIGCGSPGYPGVYTRTSTYADWIEKNTRE